MKSLIVKCDNFIEMTGTLKLEIPSQGWKQFLTSRKEMLDSYDKAKIQSKSHEVETYHGNVAEAEFRKWLENFLPKKYGVTSGYIISQGVSGSKKAPHFDVIIFEQLESPILWIEGNPDSSHQGQSRAIPAEYVRGVIEVKSSFSKKTVKDSIKHLQDLKELLSGIDQPDERFKMYLPNNFICGIAFFELRKENSQDIDALNLMREGFYIRGFSCALILRGEGHDKEYTCKLDLGLGETSINFLLEKPNWSSLNPSEFSESIEVGENQHLCVIISWSEMAFSRYAFDIVALLNGTYKSGILSSFHAFGSSQLEESRKKS